MAKVKADQQVCGICHKKFPTKRMVATGVIRPRMAEELEQQIPGWSDTGYICADDLQKFRRKILEDLLVRERGELTDLDRSVVESIAQHETISEDVEDTYDDTTTFGDRLADRMAGFAGSWIFIISFGLILAAWMAINIIPDGMTPFDPYPFILLNLVLSCIAAIQAPLIMMSQRRVEAKDRLRSENDYKVNLKAELEIRHLHEKLDHHLLKQWERLAEIQQTQLELLELSNGRRP